MQLSIGRFFEGLSIGAVIWRAIAALAAAVLFFSFIYYMAYEPKTLPETPYQRIIPAVAAKIAVGMLLTLYVVYAIFQFAYLTGLKGLPEGLTYSQYAVQGFGELCAVSIINIGVYALFLHRSGGGYRSQAFPCGADAFRVRTAYVRGVQAVYVH